MMLIDEYIARYTAARDNLINWINSPSIFKDQEIKLTGTGYVKMHHLLWQYQQLLNELQQTKQNIRYPVEPDLHTVEQFLSILK